MNKREEERLRKQQEKLQKELERLETMRIYEKEYASCKYICGIDEVGRGPVLLWQEQLFFRQMYKFYI